MNSVLPIYVINLDRVPDRFAFVKDQFASANLAARVQRFAARDARSSDFSSPGYAPHGKNDRWELELSERGVFESHRAIWSEIAEKHPQGAVICEDDILVSRSFGTILDELDLSRFGVIKLDGFSASRRYGPAIEMGQSTVRAIVEAVPSAACYAISQNAAQILLEASQSYCSTLDDFVFEARSGLTPVQLFPAIAVQGMCCGLDDVGEVQKLIGSSERETPGTSRKASKGPIRFRLPKELNRFWNRAGRAFGSDQRLVRSGGMLGYPELAPDLPAYKL